MGKMRTELTLLQKGELLGEMSMEPKAKIRMVRSGKLFGFF
jgi:hypothetical protein